ncbi:MAG: PEP-CTERM sorting domain-containing protein [Planctomycetota bacterium]
MRILVALLAVALMAAPAFGDWYYRGEYNGWGSTLMTDNSDGTFSIGLGTLGALPDDRTTWKFADTNDPGDWDWPGSGDSWGYTDGSGNLTITLDTNTYADGWVNDDMRIKLDYDPGHQWQAVGDFNGWNASDPTWNMSSLGGGIYEVQGTIAVPGDHWWKAIEAGTWDAIGGDARSVNADNVLYTTTVPNETVVFQVDVLNGVVPEPTSLALLGLGALTLLRRRR